MSERVTVVSEASITGVDPRTKTVTVALSDSVGEQPAERRVTLVRVAGGKSQLEVQDARRTSLVLVSR